MYTVSFQLVEFYGTTCIVKSRVMEFGLNMVIETLMLG